MTGSTERLTAALSDRYRLERELGAGGMATVYLAEDLKHHRQVAIKVLRPELAALLGAERFLKEIETTANLQHPHILPLFDSGQADSFLYYVMPYVSGESLRARLTRDGELPVAEAVRIARAVASALGAAHRRGIVHRDIKPENILLADGEPVVADFGIARAIAASAGDRLTSTGLAVGTPAYMSPEQATADPRVDGRTDLYSLGAVLYEMLAGEQPFRGRTAEAITARKLTEDAPALHAVRPAVPEALDLVVRKALARTAGDRFQTAEELVAALDQASRSDSGATRLIASNSPRAAWVRWTPWLLAAGFGGLAVWALLGDPQVTASGRETKLSIVTPPGTQLVVNYAGAAVSPDGETVVFAAGTVDSFRLYARRLDDWTARPLAGTEGVIEPFFSPDGQAVGFLSTSDRRLKWVSLAGGAPHDICAAPFYTAAAWADNDTIYFSDGGTSGALLRKVAVGGGAVGEVGQVVEGSPVAGTVRVLPGSRQALIDMGASIMTGSVALVDLATGTFRVLLRDAGWPRWVAPGFVVFSRSLSGELAAVPLDTATGAISGTPVTILSGVSGAAFWSVANVWDVSAGGTLVYAPLHGPYWTGKLLLTDRKGNPAGPLPLPPDIVALSPRFSPDGSRLAFERWFGPRPQIWRLELSTGELARVSSGDRLEVFPLWSVDGSALAFMAYTDTLTLFRGQVLRQPISGGSVDALTEGRTAVEIPQGWARDGNELVFSRWTAAAQDIYAAPVGELVSRPVLATSLFEATPAISPRGGRWMAYVRNAAGEFQVFVRRYPDGEDVRVSGAGGIEPLWGPDGRTLYFRSANGEEVYAAAVSGTDLPEVARPVRLFLGRFYVSGMTFSARQWDISPDGSRFVGVTSDAIHTRNGAGLLAGSELRVVPNLPGIIERSLEGSSR